MQKKKALAPSVTHRDPKGRKFTSIVETAYDKAELTEEEAQRVNDTPGLADLVANFIAESRKPKDGTPFLRLLTKEPLVVGPTDGFRIIADASDTFPGWIDSDFRNWDADEPGKATDATLVNVYEMVQDATFANMFGSLAADVSQLCLTQNQIIEFVKTHRDHLRTNGYATSFLFRSYGRLLVACVGFRGGGRLEVDLRHFGDYGVWGAGRRHRLVAPQLAKPQAS